MGFDYRHPAYRVARQRAMSRSGGACQICGQRAATDAHHWAIDYPEEASISPDDLTAVCSICHAIATTVRRFRGSGWQLVRAVREV